MGISLNFGLVEFFRPVKYRARPREHLCGTRILHANSAQKERKQKNQVYVCKKLKNRSVTFLFLPLSPYKQLRNRKTL